jgi:type IV pilus assembly protein PilM
LSKTVIDRIGEVFRPQAPLWACELTSKSVIVAGVDPHRRRIAGKLAADLVPDVLAGSLTDVNIRNRESLHAGLRRALEQANFKGSEIAVVVPDDAARIAFLTAEKQFRDPEEQKAFIRWKLKKTVPFDVDSAQVAFNVLGPHRGVAGFDMLVALSPRSIVEEYENLFDSLDVHAGMILPSTLAALNLIDAPTADTLFVKVAPDCITTTVFQQGRLQFFRRVSGISVYDAVYPTVLYYQDKLGGTGLENLTICAYDSDVRSGVLELEHKLGLHAARLEPKSLDDVFKPAFGAVQLQWENVL